MIDCLIVFLQLEAANNHKARLCRWSFRSTTHQAGLGSSIARRALAQRIALAALAIFLMLNAVTPFITPDPPWLANLPLVVLCLLRRERRDTAPARCACFRNERVDHTQSL